MKRKDLSNEFCECALEKATCKLQRVLLDAMNDEVGSGRNISSTVLTKKKELTEEESYDYLNLLLVNHIPIVEIRNIKLPDDIELVRKLWTDYLTWGNETMQINYGVHPHNPTKIVEQDIKEIDRYLPPNGQVFLAFIENKACGIGCLNNLE